MRVNPADIAPALPTSPEKAERPAPDRDGASDDAAATTQATKAPTAPGTGFLVDLNA
jgi:hypothetical protein